MEIGKEYSFIHSRKGKFDGILVSDEGEWLTIELTDGKTKMISEWNDEVIPGEQITVRKSFVSAEVKPVEQE